MSITAISASTYEPENYSYYSYYSADKINSSEEYISSNRKKVEETLKAEPDGSREKKMPGEELSPEEKKKLEKLKRRDREVRIHEQAHVSAGGAYVRGGAQFEYVTGPDGNQYANAGEVSIEVSEVPNNPEATISKARTIKAAALAPAEPSSADRAIASQATQMELKAQQELLKLKSEGKKEGTYNKEGVMSSTSSPGPSVMSEKV